MTGGMLRVWGVALVAASPMVATGCYVQRIPVAAPAPGTYVVVDLSDRGRVALEQRVGPSVASVEGPLQSVEDSALVLTVSRTVTLRGTSTRWSGEAVRIHRDHIGFLRERHFSAGRTVVLAGSLAIGIGAFVASRGLFGIGSEGGSNNPPPPPSEN